MQNFIIIFALVLLAVQNIQAQGEITYLSNLGQTSTGSNPVGSDSWWAEGIFTGSNSEGYVLNSLQLQMDAATGNPSDFTVSIFADTVDSPAGSIGILNGSLNPSAAGFYTYTSSGIMLSPNTIYFVVVTAATPLATGSYIWSISNAVGQPIGGWEFNATYLDSADGVNWNTGGRLSAFQLGVTATAIPEPSAWNLLLLGGGVFIYVRTRKHHSV